MNDAAGSNDLDARPFSEFESIAEDVNAQIQKEKDAERERTPRRQIQRSGITTNKGHKTGKSKRRIIRASRRRNRK